MNAQQRALAKARLNGNRLTHTPGGYGGVPQSVGREFNKQNTGKKRSKLPERLKRMRKRGAISDKVANKHGYE